MKRMLVLLLCLLLPLMALAQEEMPEEVQALLDEYNGVRLAAEHVRFTLEDGRQVVLTLTEGGSIVGFECKDGEWQTTLMTTVMDALRPAYVEYAADDALGFHLTSADNTTRLTYRYDGEQFRLTGWVISGCRPVTVEGDTLIYGEGADAFETVLPGGVTDWPWDADDLPLTPERARELAAITEPEVADLYPGYTLRVYYSYNTGTEASASYTRVEDGLLHIRRVSFKAGGEPRVMDCMPVPLSETLLARLKTEPFDTLIGADGQGEAFLTDDPLDSSRIAFDGRILSSDIQRDALVLLMETETGGIAQRFVYVCEYDPQTGLYSMRRTQPLPPDVSLDLFHAGEGEISFEWNGQRYQAAYSRRADGSWRLVWAGDYGPGGAIYSARWYGLETEDGMCIGSFAGQELFSADLNSLLSDPVSALNRSGWAVVHNPDPADRLHLRVSADRASASLGKFYSGTPVQVMSREGAWCHVRIGLGESALTGWMKAEYLTFGPEMDGVKEAFPQLFFREEYEGAPGFDAGFRVIGVDGTLFILMQEDGALLTCPQGWLWEGNG